MTMPKWHEAMYPILEALASCDGYMTSKQLNAVLVEFFSMTEEERAERLRSGQLRLSNRMGWAVVDLEKAGYLSYGDERGTYRITQAGREFLGRHGDLFTAKDLMAESESFREWKNGYLNSDKTERRQLKESESVPREELPPLESMQISSDELHAALSEDLLQEIMQKSPWFFEHLVGELLNAMGYGAAVEESLRVTSKSNDEGIDGVVKEDKLGFDSVYYQAKRWDLDRTVGRPDIQSFVGALSGKGATKGLFITTAKFSNSAREYAESIGSPRIVLVDGRALANLMIDSDVGVSTVSVFKVKQLDSDFFIEG